MSKSTWLLIPLGAFLAAISTHTAAYSQQDSLVDCFPLSNGNQWIYHYEHTISEETGLNEISTFDTGSAVYTILGRSDFADSALWLFKERRDIRHFVRDWSGTLTDSTIIDSALFNLVEIKSGRHEIYRRADYLGSLWLSDSGVLGNSVIPFLPNMSDTGRMYRYYQIDSLQSITFHLEYDSLDIGMWVTVRKNIGMLSIEVTDGAGTGVAIARHQLVALTITEVHDRVQNNHPEFSGLRQNYPNPFNPSTSISYSIPKQGHVRLQIFNLLGQLIATLVDGSKSPGTYTVTWNASTRPSGLYFYRISAGEFVQTKKAILLR